MGTKQTCIPSPEIWGGIECTINRVGERYGDQLQDIGYYDNDACLDAVLSLGVRALRFPVLWERYVTQGEAHWQWVTRQLDRIRAAGVTPIAGLLHHGSGPDFTSLCDPGFPEKLAAYARTVALKYPWLEYYTPVNEPLTTARFSGLYGHWYPHARDAKSFVCILLNELKGTVRAMQEIRSINPAAKLVQTEDLARIHSTKALRYQRDFENKRRWLSFDILAGRFGPSHPLWTYFLKQGADESTLRFFLENPCPPDILGLNYYATSERFLDEALDKYPPEKHGGNHLHRYADTEAVRTPFVAGIGKLLSEVWNRYRLPIALTEVHLSCSREEQLRWFEEMYRESVKARQKGIELKAVTAWSLLGAFDWNSLLTRCDKFYESGAFDVRNRQIRETAVAKMIRTMAAGKNYEHPLLAEKGWWHEHRPSTATQRKKAHTPPLLIIGGTGTLGTAFRHLCERRKIPFVAPGRTDLNFFSERDIEQYINRYKPWALVNAAGYTEVDLAESLKDDCYAVNTILPSLLAAVCKTHSMPFASFSSDLVFNGTKNDPYLESDIVCPLNVYGRSKADAERIITANHPDALVVRTSAFFGPWDRYNFLYRVIESGRNGTVFSAANDVCVSPTYVPDLVNATLDLLIDEASGIWHLSNEGYTTWAALAENTAIRAGISKTSLRAVPAAEMGWRAERPAYSVLYTNKTIRLPALENAIERFFMERVA